mmetsp:Transcript_8000/g.18577  ORF Transcript_8000/g.18577 Transcript_8000/m.18577 type:complete len:217 (+) Transcript_8000:413-1063(+)
MMTILTSKHGRSRTEAVLPSAGCMTAAGLNCLPSGPSCWLRCAQGSTRGQGWIRSSRWGGNRSWQAGWSIRRLSRLSTLRRLRGKLSRCGLPPESAMSPRHRQQGSHSSTSSRLPGRLYRQLRSSKRSPTSCQQASLRVFHRTPTSSTAHRRWCTRHRFWIPRFAPRIPTRSLVPRLAQKGLCRQGTIPWTRAPETTYWGGPSRPTGCRWDRPICT